jgi:hypothetical protein
MNLSERSYFQARLGTPTTFLSTGENIRSFDPLVSVSSRADRNCLQTLELATSSSTDQIHSMRPTSDLNSKESKSESFIEEVKKTIRQSFRSAAILHHQI